MRNKLFPFIALIIAGLILSCSSRAPMDTNKVSADSNEVQTESTDLSTNAEQEINIPNGHPFKKVKEGMTYAQVYDILGEPDEWNEYQTAKAFIPFYFGSDVRCADALYKNLGTIVFATGGFGEPTVIDVICDDQNSTP